jgi:small subunit ribosomal protein S9
MAEQEVYYATGKRKTAIARTWITPGSGKITINNRTLEDYFPRESQRIMLLKPLTMTSNTDTYDIKVRVLGGGSSGQMGAVRHGITRALMEANPDHRQMLKKAGFVKRDPRAKERKKYGLRGARARYQFSKR